MNKLSKREKYLLIVAGVMATVFVLWYVLISPQLSARGTLATEKQNLEGQVEVLAASAIPLEDYPKLLAEITDQFEEIASQYQPAQFTEDIDRLLTTSANARGLVPSRIDISQPAELTASGTESQEAMVPHRVYQVVIRQSLSGSKDNLESYVDFIRGLEGVQITIFNYTASNSGQSGIEITYVLNMLES